MLEKLNWFHLTGLITLVTSAIDVKMDGSVTAEKSSVKMLGWGGWGGGGGVTLSSKFDWCSYIISIAKSASKKIGTLICSMKFLSPEFALYLYESNI